MQICIYTYIYIYIEIYTDMCILVYIYIFINIIIYNKYVCVIVCACVYMHGDWSNLVHLETAWSSHTFGKKARTPRFLLWPMSATMFYEVRTQPIPVSQISIDYFMIALWTRRHQNHKDRFLLRGLTFDSPCHSFKCSHSPFLHALT